jgi:hypothetical protein
VRDSRIDPGALHGAEVDDEASVAHGLAGHPVARGSNGDQEVVRASELHRPDDVRGSGAPSDHRRPSVDHPVEHGARVVVLWIDGQDEASSQALSEVLDGVLR